MGIGVKDEDKYWIMKEWVNVILYVVGMFLEERIY